MRKMLHRCKLQVNKKLLCLPKFQIIEVNNQQMLVKQLTRDEEDQFYSFNII
jgi:hypothetical protein